MLWFLFLIWCIKYERTICKIKTWIDERSLFKKEINQNSSLRLKMNVLGKNIFYVWNTRVYFQLVLNSFLCDIRQITASLQILSFRCVFLGVAFDAIEPPWNWNCIENWFCCRQFWLGNVDYFNFVSLCYDQNHSTLQGLGFRRSVL